MRFTVTNAHLGKAIREKRERSFANANVCPVYQVIAEKFSGDNVIVYGNDAVIGSQKVRTTPNMRRIINLFDDKEYGKLRNLLPLSFVLSNI